MAQYTSRQVGFIVDIHQIQAKPVGLFWYLFHKLSWPIPDICSLDGFCIYGCRAVPDGCAENPWLATVVRASWSSVQQASCWWLEFYSIIPSSSLEAQNDNVIKHGDGMKLQIRRQLLFMACGQTAHRKQSVVAELCLFCKLESFKWTLSKTQHIINGIANEKSHAHNIKHILNLIFSKDFIV